MPSKANCNDVDYRTLKFKAPTIKRNNKRNDVDSTGCLGLRKGTATKRIRNFNMFFYKTVLFSVFSFDKNILCTGLRPLKAYINSL